MKLTAVGRFALHYVEMVIAMLLGMVLIHPFWMMTTSALAPGSVLQSVEAESLAMATTMALPMAGWMRFRGHGWAPTVEMCLAMYAGFVLLFPFLWAEGVGEDAVLAFGHVLMLVFMLIAMLWRWHEYAGCTSEHREPAPERHTMTAL